MGLKRATLCPGCGGEGRAGRYVKLQVRHYVCVSCAGRWGVRETIVSDTFTTPANEADLIKRWRDIKVPFTHIAKALNKSRNWFAPSVRRKTTNAEYCRRYRADPENREVLNLKRRLRRQQEKTNAE